MSVSKAHIKMRRDGGHTAITVHTLSWQTTFFFPRAWDLGGYELSSVPSPIHASPLSTLVVLTLLQHPLSARPFFRDKSEDRYSRAVSRMSLFPISKVTKKKPSVSSVKTLSRSKASMSLRKRMSTSWFSWLSLLIKNILCYRVLKKGSTIFFFKPQTSTKQKSI